MEDTLRVYGNFDKVLRLFGLNPCFNGRYSQRVMITFEQFMKESLNPCFNGRYSQSLHGNSYARMVMS